MIIIIMIIILLIILILRITIILLLNTRIRNSLGWLILGCLGICERDDDKTTDLVHP